MPTVSVLMCAYNEPIEYIKQSTNSILNQSYQDYEFIIVLDNPDNKELEQYLNGLCVMDHRVHLYINEKNLGLVDSLNRGLTMCHGKYIARMDADDIAIQDRLVMQLEYLETHRIDLVGALYKFYYGGSVLGEIEHGPEKHCDIIETLKKYDCIAHPTWFGKSEVFQKLKGYRPVKSCEDYDFLLRAAQSGYILGNVQEVLLWYRINENGISKTTYVHQKVVTKYLARCFRRNEQIELIDVKSFIQSIDYQRLYIVYDCYGKHKAIHSIRTLFDFVGKMLIPAYFVTYLKYKS